MRRKNQVELNLGTGVTGEARSSAAQEIETGAAKACLERPAAGGPSMEAIVERNNLRKALEQVRRNKGAPGVDGMSVNKLASHLKEHWLAIRAQLLEGTYEPQPVRVEIPKASGGTRALGIPTVLDRFIQLSHRGRADRWAGRADGGGYAARWTALAAVVEPDAGRTGQGIGEARPSLRALRRRLQHLCAQPAGGRAGDDGHRAVP